MKRERENKSERREVEMRGEIERVREKVKEMMKEEVNKMFGKGLIWQTDLEKVSTFTLKIFHFIKQQQQQQQQQQTNKQQTNKQQTNKQMTKEEIERMRETWKKSEKKKEEEEEETFEMMKNLVPAMQVLLTHGMREFLEVMEKGKKEIEKMKREEKTKKWEEVITMTKKAISNEPQHPKMKALREFLSRDFSEYFFFSSFFFFFFFFLRKKSQTTKTNTQRKTVEL